MNYRVSEFRYGEFRLRTILLYYLIWVLSMTFAIRAVFFRQKCRVGKKKRRNDPPQQVVGKGHYQIFLFYAIKHLLPIVLFVGQHFSGSLFEWVHLSI